MAKRRPKTIAALAKDTIWIYEHWEELCKSYGGKVIGVDNGAVVAVAQSNGHLVLELKSQGLAPAEVAVQYINADPSFVKSFLAMRDEKIKGLHSGDISP